ncbi:family 20 glycosylhydrolase [Streptomyces oryzae]|uniref:Family 20 glycosylhydrolase n=1 Tax=Streptomyces oryzae TaxID=1434886 RepID=A0ABS3XG62_9ACTN|nr:glycoside hydrolase family 20 protein [Streptomyces oryzae]MBO8194017.1 family 20 glycosylhydrolase [Streptomyces oryzae]
MGRKWSKKSEGAADGAVGRPGTLVALALAAGLVGLTSLTGCSGNGDGDGGGEAPSASASHRDRGSQQPPKGADRLGPAPSAVPSVREWKAVRGPGWQRTQHTRVVTGADSLRDEAELLAGELQVDVAKGPAHTGDIELRREKSGKGDGKGGTSGKDGKGGKDGKDGKGGGKGEPGHGPESYRLVSRAGKVTITGNDDAGVFYGTRTLLQTHRAQGRFAEGTVLDAPDRTQRGFSLDIARKHFSADWIKARIREMGNLKLNQLQLHLSDDQAFRIESDTHPEIVSDPHLTKAEVRDIVRLAASRHITVIPEIDSPGHLGAVIKAHPDLQLRSATGRTPRGAVDIGNPAAAKLVDDLLAEFADLFPGQYAHAGGDEYQALMAENPEQTYPGLAAKAREKFGKKAKVQDLATDWLNDRAATLREHGKTPQVWNDGMHRGGVVKPDKPRQVAYWTGREPGERQPVEYLKEGWKVVNLNDKYLYYVLGQPNKFTYPTGRLIYEDWTPAVVRGTKPVPGKWAGRDRIVGGRFAVWGDLANAQTTEQVARGIRLPLAATAQKLWDPGRPERSWSDFVKLVDKVG